MRSTMLILRNLRHYAGSYVAVGLGTALAAAVIAGALFVGDSVRQTLRDRMLARLGDYDYALVQQGSLFGDDLASRVHAADGVAAAAVLALSGSLTRDVAAEETPGQVNGVSVYGVTAVFWTVGGQAAPLELDAAGIALNAETARRLGAAVGDSLVLRLPKPSLLPRDSVLGDPSEATASRRLTVRAVLAAGGLADFSLRADNAAPANAFLARETLQAMLDQPGRANLLLAAEVPGEAWFPDAALTLADAGLRWQKVRPEADDSFVDLRSETGFLAMADPAAAAPVVAPIFTYFVNGLTVGKRTTPYSMVSGLMPERAGDFGMAWLPADLADDQVVITDWLAADTGATPGDTLMLRYWVEATTGGLEEREARFTVRAIVPLAQAADPTLMPDWPGMADAEHCRDWDTGAPVDMARIRDQDEAYWAAHGGSPKAFITLARARELWSGRYGDVSLLRVQPDGPMGGAVQALVQPPPTLRRESLDLRGQVQAAVAKGTDFGGLFAALSVFLIVAALVLQGLLLRLLAERRAPEWGTLLALGFLPGWLRGLAWREMAAVVALGSVVGCALGVLYTRAVLAALNARWQAAVGQTVLDLHVTWRTAALALAVCLLVGLASGAWALWRAGRLPALELLQGGRDAYVRRPWGGWLVLGGGLVGIGGGGSLLRLLQIHDGTSVGPGSYFAVSVCLLLGLVLTAYAQPARLPAGRLPAALQGLVRAPGRSLAVIVTVALGVYLTLAIGVNQGDPTRGADDPAGGTGGFDFWIETTTPVLQRLDTPDGQAALGLDADAMAGATVLHGVVRAGDDASCLNLTRAAEPQLLGLDFAALYDQRFTVKAAPPYEDTWRPNWFSPRLNDRVAVGPELPVYGDANMLTYNLGLALGDTLQIGGRPVQVRGSLAPSILQGYLVTDAPLLRDAFPQLEGYRVLLVDAPAGREAAVRDELAYALADYGVEITPATERLGRFMAVQNTYLAIFQFLGLLALVLGLAGMAIIVSRNVLERRREFAIMRAIGFRRRQIRHRVILEHAGLLAAGIGIGALAALLPGTGGASGWLAVVALILGLFLIGHAWTVAASLLALRGDVVDALRRE